MPPSSPDNLVRISQAARQAGVSVQTVEYYIMVGLVQPIRRGKPPARWFDQAAIRRVRLIKSLNASGYTLRDIRETWLSGKGKHKA